MRNSRALRCPLLAIASKASNVLVTILVQYTKGFSIPKVLQAARTRRDVEGTFENSVHTLRLSWKNRCAPYAHRENHVYSHEHVHFNTSSH